MRTEIFTIGHSTHSQEDFLLLLQKQKVRLLVDIRRYPTSQRQAHFQRSFLQKCVETSGISYTWEPDLGGMRTPKLPNSPHTGWQHPAFVGYAEHMETSVFQDAAHAVKTMAQTKRTVVMCAEAWPHSCHRRLLSDWFLTQHVDVKHILPNSLEAHVLTPFARIQENRILYDRGQQKFSLF